MDMALLSEVVFSSREDKAYNEARKSMKKKREPEEKRVIIKDIKQFFGPIVDPAPTPDTDRSQYVADDEIPKIGFRLRGLSHKINYYDPVTDMVISRREAGMHIRAAEDEYHNHLNQEPKPSIKKSDTGTAQQRMFDRMQRAMGMSCLNAVHKAYEERHKAERRAAKLEYVMNMKEDRDTAKERIRLFNEEKRRAALKDREKDHKNILDIMETRELQRLNYINKNKDVRQKSSHYQKTRRGELTFMKDFNVQNTSVSNALLRHDRQARHEDKQAEKLDIIQSHKIVEGEQQSMVKTYLEHRQLMRQTETAMSRAAIDTKMLQEANDRLSEARSRVAQQKSRLPGDERQKWLKQTCPDIAPQASL